MGLSPVVFLSLSFSLLQLIGYAMGTSILPISDVRNYRLASSVSGQSVPTMTVPITVPSDAKGIFGSPTTYVSTRNDHYSFSIGNAAMAVNSWDNEPSAAGSTT